MRSLRKRKIFLEPLLFKESIKNDNSGVNNHNIILFLLFLWVSSIFYGFNRVYGLEMELVKNSKMW